MVPLGIVMGAFQYRIAQTLKKKGANTSLFTFLPSDIKHYYRLMNAEKDDTVRSQMKVNYYGIIITSCSALIIAATVILKIFI